MPPEQQVVSLELAKELKELGVKQESLFYWSVPLIEKAVTKEQEEELKKCKTELYYRGNDWGEYFESVSAPTVAELGEVIPYWLDIEGQPQIACYGQGKNIQAVDLEKNQIVEYEGKSLQWRADTEADARAKCLCYLLKGKIIELK